MRDGAWSAEANDEKTDDNEQQSTQSDLDFSHLRVGFFVADPVDDVTDKVSHGSFDRDFESLQELLSELENPGF